MFATKTREHDKKVLEQGIEQGIEETARRMQDEGFEEEVISKITGLSQKILQELKERQK